MELAEYLGRIWARKWMILGIMILAVCLEIGVLYLIPRQYTSTVILESGAIQSFLTNPGTIRDTGRQSVPSTIQPVTEVYLKILESPSVKAEAQSIMQNLTSTAETTEDTGSVRSDGYPQSSSHGASVSGDFTYSARAQFVRDSESDLLYIEASADEPEVAQRAADTLAGILMVKSTELGGDTADQFIESISKQQIEPIDEKLEAIRTESETVKASTDIGTSEKNVRVAALAVETKALEDSRKQYTDLIARVQINESLNTNNLRFLTAANLPDSREQPDIVKNAMVTLIISFLVGVIGMAAIDRQSVKASTIF